MKMNNEIDKQVFIRSYSGVKTLKSFKKNLYEFINKVTKLRNY